MRASHSMIALLAVLSLATPARSAELEWEQSNLPVAFDYALAAGPEGRLIAIGGGSVYRSMDDGATWTLMGAFVQNAMARHAGYTSDGSLYASDFAVGVFRSDDDGAHWSSSLVDEGCNGFAVSAQDILFAGLTYTGNGKVHRSGDGGSAWASIPLPGATQSFSTECFAFGDNGEVYAGTIDGFYRSTDQGLNWQESSTGLLGQHIRTMAVAPDQKVYIQTLYPSQLDGFYRSSDRGLSWTRLGPGGDYFSDLAATLTGELLGVSEDQVHVSADEGVTWYSQSTGIAVNERLSDILVTQTGRVLLGGRRVYRSTTAVLDASPRSLPGTISLGLIAPQPVRGDARIRFALPRAAVVRLALYDIAGRQVAVLADGAREAGEHVAHFDARGLSPGAYVCELTAGDARLSRRVVVVR